MDGTLRGIYRYDGAGLLEAILVSHKFTHVSHGGVAQRELGAKTSALTTCSGSSSGSFCAPAAGGTTPVAINRIVAHDATWRKCRASSCPSTALTVRSEGKARLRVRRNMLKPS